jgi:tripartite ATP-independent transporter DctM subunit
LQGELSFQDLFHCAAQTVKTLGVLAILIACAAPFTWIMGINNVGQGLEHFFLGISQNKYVFLLVINVLLLLAGSIMETTVILLIVVPIVSPLIAIYGIDPIHFGIIVILNLLLGTLTPPFGVLLFVMMDLTGISLYKLLRAIMPFYIPILFFILVITFVPTITTFIPNLIGR